MKKQNITIDTIAKHKKKILQLARKFGVLTIRIFGSVARGQANAKSDIDFLVTMKKGRSYFDLIDFSYSLEEIFKRRVDVVTERSLHPYIRDKILQEAVPL